jgi:hypothetical protein
MTRAICCALAILAAIVAAPAAQHVPTLQAGDIVITGGQLFDSVRDTLAPNTGIVVRRGIFLEVGANLTGRDTSAATVVQLEAGDTVLPGLFDLHAHYAIDLFGEGRVDEYTVNPLVFLANGVTSTFPGGEVDPDGMMQARIRIERGEQIGPRILNSGPYFGTARLLAVGPDRVRLHVDVGRDLLVGPEPLASQAPRFGNGARSGQSR